MSGQIDISALKVPPEKEELETAKYFADKGKDVTFLRPSAIPKIRTPDIQMDGVEWEIKCPKGDGKRTVINCVKKAVKQSPNVIVDLRHLKNSESVAIEQLEREFVSTTKLRKLIIVKKNNTDLTLKKRG